MKENMDNFSPILLNYFNSIIDFSSFLNHLKLANVTPVHKKDSRNVKETVDQLVYYQTYQTFFKISWISRSLRTLKLFIPNKKLVSAEVWPRLAVRSLFSSRIAKNIIDNYASTLFAEKRKSSQICYFFLKTMKKNFFFFCCFSFLLNKIFLIQK